MKKQSLIIVIVVGLLALMAIRYVLITQNSKLKNKNQNVQNVQNVMEKVISITPSGDLDKELETTIDDGGAGDLKQLEQDATGL